MNGKNWENFFQKINLIYKILDKSFSPMFLIILTKFLFDANKWYNISDKSSKSHTM